MSREYQICTRCIMDTTDPDIVFDEKGECNHCRSYDKLADRKLFSNEKERVEALNYMLDKIKSVGKKNEYDCIIGLSGGVDSSYVALKVKECGLRPLAVHLDNGWNSELAVQNITNIVKKLDIDLITHVIDWEEFKDMQLAYFKASVVDIEVLTDHAIWAILYKTANKYNIKYIINGSNIASEAILPMSWISDKNDLRNIKAIHSQFGTVKNNTYPQLGILRLNYYKVIKKIKTFLILNYIDYNKDEAKQLIQKKLGWRDYGGKHHESFFTKIFQEYILPVKFKIDKRRAHLSTLICSKQITRKNALLELQKNSVQNSTRTENMNYLIKKMGISKEEFEEIMNLPVKHYTDYPSYHNSIIYNSIKYIYIIIKRAILRGD